MDLGGLFWYSVLLGSSVLIFDLWRRKTYCRLPPGPWGWPIVGNLLQVGKKTHESFFHLAIKYGPLMSLSLGMKTTVVVSSSAMAKEVLKTHDHILSGRMLTQAGKALSHYKTSIVFGQYGSHWRMLRRVSSNELFSVKRLEALLHHRKDQVNQMIHRIFEDAVKPGKSVDIGHTVFQSAFNLLGKMVFGKDVLDAQFAEGTQELKYALSKVMVLYATPNLADFFPCLQFLDPQSVYRNTNFYFRKVYDVIDKFIKYRLVTRSDEGRDRSYGEKDLLDVLLDLRSDEFTVDHIRGYLVVCLFLVYYVLFLLSP